MAKLLEIFRAKLIAEDPGNLLWASWDLCLKRAAGDISPVGSSSPRFRGAAAVTAPDLRSAIQKGLSPFPRIVRAIMAARSSLIFAPPQMRKFMQVFMLENILVLSDFDLLHHRITACYRAGDVLSSSAPVQMGRLESALLKLESCVQLF